MKRFVGGGALVGAMLLAQGCSTNNFLVYKGAGRHSFVASERPELRRILCDSGDMDTIVHDANLPLVLQIELKFDVCWADKVRDRLLATLDGMTREQRNSLKDAFRDKGYDLNTVANC